MESTTESTEISLTDWVRDESNKPDDTLIYRTGLYSQIEKVKEFAGLLWANERGCSDYLFKDYYDRITVASTHMSKSVTLPVYRIVWKGITFIIRYNFYDWKVSIDSPFPLDMDFEDTFNYDEKIPSVYCEGFSDDWVYGSYNENNKKFTIGIGGDELYVFFRKIWYSIRVKEKDELPMQNAVQDVINMIPKDFKERRGSEFKTDLEGIRDEAIASSSRIQRWSYLSTIMSLNLSHNKEVDPEIRDNLYQAAFGHPFYKTA